MATLPYPHGVRQCRIAAEAAASDSSSESFKADLLKAIDETGATLAFDAIGGGELVSNILAAMEQVGSNGAGRQQRRGRIQYLWLAN